MSLTPRPTSRNGSTWTLTALKGMPRKQATPSDAASPQMTSSTPKQPTQTCVTIA